MQEKLSKIIADMVEIEVEKLLEKERNSPDYLNKKYYGSCRERVEAGMEIAMKKPIDFLVLAAATHGEQKHKEVNTIEIEESSKSLSIDEQRLARTGTFWIG